MHNVLACSAGCSASLDDAFPCAFQCGDTPLWSCAAGCRRSAYEAQLNGAAVRGCVCAGFSAYQLRVCCVDQEVDGVSELASPEHVCLVLNIVVLLLLECSGRLCRGSLECIPRFRSGSSIGASRNSLSCESQLDMHFVSHF